MGRFPLLVQHQLQWHDIGRNPDCQFASFLHAAEETVPDHDAIMRVRRAVKSWLFAHKPSYVESTTAWQDQNKAFGFATEQRKQGNEYSLRAMASCFSTRINLITVSTSGHHIQEYFPLDNIQHKKEIWLLYMNFEHTRHYLSTTKIQNLVPTIPPPPPPTTRAENGTSARARPATGSTEPIDDPAQAVGSSSRVAVSAPARQTSSALQGESQNSQPISNSEDIFANINYVEGDFARNKTMFFCFIPYRNFTPSIQRATCISVPSGSTCCVQQRSQSLPLRFFFTKVAGRESSDQVAGRESSSP